MKPIWRKFKSFSPKVYWREVLAILMLLLAFVFFRGERKELEAIIPHIKHADSTWLAIGVFITLTYVFFQSGMYVKSFQSIGLKVSWLVSIELFLKRNFLSVFLPAGGVSALAYSPSQLRKQALNKTQIHQASGLYAFAGLLTLFVVGLPVIIYSITGSVNTTDAAWGLVLVTGMIATIFLFTRSLRQKSWLYKLIERKFPSFLPSINELFDTNVSTQKYAGAILFSTGVELTGIFHIYIAMQALGLHASVSAAAIGYVVSVLLMVVSPFLRGLGAVEFSLVYVLELYGYTSIQALGITILYRVFEFWLPLALGLISFAWKGKQLFIRIAPAILIFILGLINIISVVTPPLAYRLRLTKEFLPVEAIHASNILVLFLGLALLVTSAFLIKGLRSAFYMALILSAVSLVGNLTKALDYEEASFAAVIFILLLLNAKQYRIRSSIKWVRLGIVSVVAVFVAVCIFGFVSFYFIDKKHFNVDFTWRQSILHTAKIFLLVQDGDLNPVTRFGHEFISVIRILGFVAWGFFVFTLIKPYLHLNNTHETLREKAKFLLNEYGNSAVDYFKLYKDKLFFFSDLHDAFIAYRIANGFAVVLEEPVCAEDNKLEVLEEFDQHCRKMGLKSAFYRVDENSIQWFNQIRKQKVLIGQEAILEISSFSLEGRDRKSLRNGLNSLQKKGFVTQLYQAPLQESLVSELKTVSDEWLRDYDKEEMIFSQGMFDEKEISQHDIIAVRDNEGKVKAFLNIIPDFTPGECTYDLIRKTADAPGGCMDALIIELINYARQHNYQYLNLGLVPLTGITQPESPAEQLIKYVSEKWKRFRHYQSLRDFKEKYATIWENKYLVYENDFDLLQLPAALNKVMQP